MARTRRHKTADLPPLVGVAEACEIMGIGRMTLKRWRDSGFFDIEPAQIGNGPVWTRDDIERFAKEKGHRRTAASEST